jgi:hypothetical protein
MPDTQLQIFEYGTSPVRTVMIDGEPWFVGNDLCNILEIANPRNAFARLPDAMKDVHTVDTLGGQQSMTTAPYHALPRLPVRMKGSHTVTTLVRHMDEIDRCMRLTHTADEHQGDASSAYPK